MAEKLSERDRKFLLMVQKCRPKLIAGCWHEEHRRALSEGWVSPRWGGHIKVTDAGRALLEGE